MPIDRALAVSVVDQAAQAWRDESPDAFVDLFAASGVFIVPGNRWIGQTAIQKAVADYFATKTGVAIAIHQIVFENTHALVEWRWSDLDRQTQQRSQAEDAIAIDFDPEGKILRWREYIDAQ
ncbi:MAG: SgcJ/EcaC family oxidoreductase [Cyanobacteria bacterium P01_A01_bin.114]